MLLSQPIHSLGTPSLFFPLPLFSSYSSLIFPFTLRRPPFLARFSVTFSTFVHFLHTVFIFSPSLLVQSSPLLFLFLETPLLLFVPFLPLLIFIPKSGLPSISLYLLRFGVDLHLSDLGPFLPEVGVVQRNVRSVTR